jgi:hypothetical protein
MIPIMKCCIAALMLLLSANPTTSSNYVEGDVDTIVELHEDDGVNEATVDIELHDEVDSENNKGSDTGKQLHTPPTHFHITSHVQTNLATGISYFLTPEALANSYANIPFLECGAIGSTTEGVPLVSGMFRHVPNCGVVDTKRDVSILLDDENDATGDEMEEMEIKLDGEQFQESNDEEATHEHNPKRPSPPRYVVALSPFEITVGGYGNQTQVFAAGDVIFMEDSWWGIWNEDVDEQKQKDSDGTEMKGYIMRAHPDSKQDLNVMMLTVPPSVHRHWKNAHQHALLAEKEEIGTSVGSQTSARVASTSTHQPWWKLKLHRQTLPKPCSLESDPAFAHPSAASTTLAQHFTQHFVKLLQGFSHPQGSTGFLPHQDLLLPILAQGVAGAVGGATALGVVLQLWRMVPVQVAVGFGAACVIGLGTWGFIWLAEEVLDEFEFWSARRKLQKRWSKKTEYKTNLDEEEDEAKHGVDS